MSPPPPSHYTTYTIPEELARETSIDGGFGSRFSNTNTHSVVRSTSQSSVKSGAAAANNMSENSSTHQMGATAGAASPTLSTDAGSFSPIVYDRKGSAFSIDSNGSSAQDPNNNGNSSRSKAGTTAISANLISSSIMPSSATNQQQDPTNYQHQHVPLRVSSSSTSSGMSSFSGNTNNNSTNIGGSNNNNNASGGQQSPNSSLVLHIRYVSQDQWKRITFPPGITVTQARDICLLRFSLWQQSSPMSNTSNCSSGSGFQNNDSNYENRFNNNSNTNNNAGANPLMGRASVDQFRRKGLSLSINNSSSNSSGGNNTTTNNGKTGRTERRGGHRAHGSSVSSANIHADDWSQHFREQFGLFWTAAGHWLDANRTLSSYQIQMDDVVELQNIIDFVPLLPNDFGSHYTDGFLYRFHTKGMSSSWKLRWTVLKGNRLCMFKHKGDSVPERILDLNGDFELIDQDRINDSSVTSKFMDSKMQSSLVDLAMYGMSGSAGHSNSGSIFMIHTVHQSCIFRTGDAAEYETWHRVLMGVHESQQKKNSGADSIETITTTTTTTDQAAESLASYRPVPIHQMSTIKSSSSPSFNNQTHRRSHSEQIQSLPAGGADVSTVPGLRSTLVLKDVSSLANSSDGSITRSKEEGDSAAKTSGNASATSPGSLTRILSQPDGMSAIYKGYMNQKVYQGFGFRRRFFILKLDRISVYPSEPKYLSEVGSGNGDNGSQKSEKTTSTAPVEPQSIIMLDPKSMWVEICCLGGRYLLTIVQTCTYVQPTSVGSTKSRSNTVATAGSDNDIKSSSSISNSITGTIASNSGSSVKDQQADFKKEVTGSGGSQRKVSVEVLRCFIDRAREVAGWKRAFIVIAGLAVQDHTDGLLSGTGIPPPDNVLLSMMAASPFRRGSTPTNLIFGSSMRHGGSPESIYQIPTASVVPDNITQNLNNQASVNNIAISTSRYSNTSSSGGGGGATSRESTGSKNDLPLSFGRINKLALVSGTNKYTKAKQTKAGSGDCCAATKDADESSEDDTSDKMHQQQLLTPKSVSSSTSGSLTKSTQRQPKPIPKLTAPVISPPKAKRTITGHSGTTVRSNRSGLVARDVSDSDDSGDEGGRNDGGVQSLADFFNSSRISTKASIATTATGKSGASGGSSGPKWVPLDIEKYKSMEQNGVASGTPAAKLLYSGFNQSSSLLSANSSGQAFVNNMIGNLADRNVQLGSGSSGNDSSQTLTTDPRSKGVGYKSSSGAAMAGQKHSKFPWFKRRGSSSKQTAI
ncbi:hypothetical protein H4219_003579 [Mycoemilia scoparia]|uniref:PH domain-containing protein n=1 Tax=Mycoemilia scoparia TaxID=417184 RepID=A0A9W8A0V6_9FUNG|nr:hypothetical protein H4219_003579 [Mycoemilia scoparia]